MKIRKLGIMVMFIRDYSPLIRQWVQYEVNDTNLQELAMAFETKDSGDRQQFSTGMVRDVQTNKPRYDLLDMPMLKRWAELMGRGAVKYGENNWRKAQTEEELNRFKASALRHLFQWFEGDESEDHGAAVMFNIAGAEMVKAKLPQFGKLG